MKYAVKIVSCTGPYDWYKDKIGEVYEFKFMDNPIKKEIDHGEIDPNMGVQPMDYVVDKAMSNGELGSVFFADAEVLEVDDDTIIREPEIIPTDIDKLKTEMEITQIALNEILMNF